MCSTCQLTPTVTHIAIHGGKKVLRIESQTTRHVASSHYKSDGRAEGGIIILTYRGDEEQREA
jgi:hypothetical protein